jgi:hypothetical protein
MMCDCKDFRELCLNDKEVFKWDEGYGWLLHWVEITEESGYTRLHRYGIPINYCPLCGRKIKSSTEV